MKREDVQRQLSYLAGSAAAVLPEASVPSGVDRHSCAALVIGAQTLIRSAFGEDSPLFKAISALTDFSSRATVETTAGVISAATDAWRRGFVFNIQEIVRADVEADLIDQATSLHELGYQLPSAVLTGAVLEQHLRSVAPSWGVVTTTADGKALTIEPLNVELKKAGAYDTIMQKKITYLAGLRNEAAHGRSDFKERGADVGAMIRDVLDVCNRVRSK